ncbi:hypothetical protein CC1G_08229 [Coprinopsis cinerea okayama7|uniref:AB hydrolase-1 domain-containing protein n=1 Tax=Coprinopsis cinerea (strain Okayama-7 / 130 / ATCC MYA-4618 / FGSC 9003) TaxID=240176 RepID=A8P7H7_COPC7|nr:hypothetical protein CC1G_08229 [Coprinopsis cinerea okayama7\|eukprot:XP_001839362.2 hypothetical protein CC1G_08229 [Coprinopsis cinerea okayama7\
MGSTSKLVHPGIARHVELAFWNRLRSDSSFHWADNPESPGPAEILLFDNRGVGNSGYPRGPYTTSGMAEDAICLLDYIGWTNDRELHVVGISLGGMISQELSYRIPHRIASLTLAVTTPGGHVWQNLPPFSGVRSLARLLFTPDPVQKVPLVLEMLYPPEWLDSKAEGDDKGRTNREIQTEVNTSSIHPRQLADSQLVRQAYLVRVSLTIPQQFVGHISQMAAGLTHRFTPSRLKTIASKIPKSGAYQNTQITIVTGDVDNLVAPRRSRELVQGMGLTIDAAASKHTNPRDNTPREASEIQRIELVEWKETGHGINHQRAEWFNRLLERTFEEGRRVVEKEKQGSANERVY